VKTRLASSSGARFAVIGQLRSTRALDDDSEFGVLVTDTAAVVQYLWQRSSSSFVEWVPITNWWHDSAYRREVEAALRAASHSAM
jgi:hypothetical protein